MRRRDPDVVDDLGLPIYQLEDALRGANGVHELGEKRRHRGQGHGDGDGVHQEREEVARRQRAIDDLDAAVPKHADDADVASGGRSASKQAVSDRLLHAELVGLINVPVVSQLLLLLRSERPDGPDVAEGLLARRRGDREGVLVLPGDRLDVAPEENGAHDNRRYNRHHHEGELPARDEKQDDAEHDAGQSAQAHADVHGAGGLDHRGVGAQPIHELAGFLRVEEGRLLCKDRLIQLSPHSSDDSFAGEGECGASDEGEHVADQDDDQQLHDAARERPPALAMRLLVVSGIVDDGSEVIREG
mmetsp:Transcript_6397/g.24830  ORF Transcript_6397/g.24830 Transcript_6397/m.24830 type:complete len:302 (-) Transcript_6397:120-1025(-)|eukprot:scaffold149_cov315-Pinguiococcus_pyrenoidosus.AAC.157